MILYWIAKRVTMKRNFIKMCNKTTNKCCKCSQWCWRDERKLLRMRADVNKTGSDAFWTYLFLCASMSAQYRIKNSAFAVWAPQNNNEQRFCCSSYAIYVGFLVHFVSPPVLFFFEILIVLILYMPVYIRICMCLLLLLELCCITYLWQIV